MIFNNQNNDEGKNLLDERIQKLGNIHREEIVSKDSEESGLDFLQYKPKTPYKFSEPSPMPKELVSVLREMFKKLFPDARKAYLVLTEYEEKKGYLLVVDIDAKFLKIINIYLDGQTKKVRNGYPIECILYSKSGNLTEGMTPFYKKEVPEAPKSKPRSGSAVINDVPELGIDAKTIESINYEFGGATPAAEPSADENTDSETNSEDTSPKSDDATEIPEENLSTEENAVSENDASQIADEASKDEIPSMEIPSQPVKVEPETKQQLFALMNRAGASDSEDVVSVARSGFEEYKFYVPFNSETQPEGQQDTFEDGSRLVLLISRDTGIKAIAFFTDLEDAKSFAEEKGHSFTCIKYREYKEALANGIVVAPSAEGIIINPTNEKILLAPDYPLL